MQIFLSPGTLRLTQSRVCIYMDKESRFPIELIREIRSKWNEDGKNLFRIGSC